MQIYQFKKEVGKKITKFDSNFVMSRIMQTEKVTHIGCIHLEKGWRGRLSPGCRAATSINCRG